MAELTRNQALFDKIAAQIEETPDRYNQGEWRNVHAECGTAYCVAGWAVELSRGEEWFKEHEQVTTIERVNNEGAIEEHQERWVPGAYIEDTAITELGIEPEEADTLFDAAWMRGQSIDVVADALREIGNGRPIRKQT